MLKVAKRQKKEKPELVNFKVTAKDRKAIEAKADKYTEGNVSLWLRFAALNHVPKRSELDE